MLFSLKHLRKSVFGISREEASFARRGFHEGNPEARDRLERSAQTFIRGYTIALEQGDQVDGAISQLEEIEKEMRGFAYEGAGMALTLLDYFTPWTSRFSTLLASTGADHVYMLHVGAGWTLGRLPRSARALMKRLDPLLAWLALDGYGFHQGFFSWPRFIQSHARPRQLSGYELRAFDQGLGRSLWFVKCADASQIITTIATFPESRQSDLWSGIGLAAAYAGGVKRQVFDSLYEAAGEARPHLAQGAAFAAKARQRAGNPVPHTDDACHVFCGCSSIQAASITDESLENLRPGAQAYETWRSRIRARFVEHTSDLAR